MAEIHSEVSEASLAGTATPGANSANRKKRDQYAQSLKKEIDELNEKIDELTAKSEKTKAEALAAYKEEIAKLRKQYQKASIKLDQLKDASEQEWDAVVAKTNKIKDAFVHSYRYFKSQV